MTPRRELAAAVGCSLAGAALAFLSASRPWAWATLSEPGLAKAAAARGSELVPLVPAGTLAALAAAGAVLATRGTARRVLAGVLALLGLAVAVAAWRGRTPDPSFGWFGPVPSESAGQVGASGWWLVAAAGGALQALAGLWTLLRGGGWPAPGRRARPSPAPDPAGTRGEPEAGPRSRTALWDALDRGEDPTT